MPGINSYCLVDILIRSPTDAKAGFEHWALAKKKQLPRVDQPTYLLIENNPRSLYPESKSKVETRKTRTRALCIVLFISVADPNINNSDPALRFCRLESGSNLKL